MVLEHPLTNTDLLLATIAIIFGHFPLKLLHILCEQGEHFFKGVEIQEAFNTLTCVNNVFVPKQNFCRQHKENNAFAGLILVQAVMKCVSGQITT